MNSKKSIFCNMSIGCVTHKILRVLIIRRDTVQPKIGVFGRHLEAVIGTKTIQYKNYDLQHIFNFI